MLFFSNDFVNDGYFYTDIGSKIRKKLPFTEFSNIFLILQHFPIPKCRMETSFSLINLFCTYPPICL